MDNYGYAPLLVCVARGSTQYFPNIGQPESYRHSRLPVLAGSVITVVQQANGCGIVQLQPRCDGWRLHEQFQDLPLWLVKRCGFRKSIGGNTSDIITNKIDIMFYCNGW